MSHHGTCRLNVTSTSSKATEDIYSIAMNLAAYAELFLCHTTSSSDSSNLFIDKHFDISTSAFNSSITHGITSHQYQVHFTCVIKEKRVFYRNKSAATVLTAFESIVI